jgi:hypothetical protein
LGYTLTCSVRLRVASEHFRFLRDIIVLIFFFFSPVLATLSVSNSSSLHSADDNCILGKLEFVGDRIVEENQEFCSLEGEYVLDEPAESFMVGNHKF